MNRNSVKQLRSPTTISDSSRGFEAFYNYTEVLTGGDYHCHDYYEFYIHLRGGQYYGIGEKMYRLLPNQLFIIPPGIMHGLSFEGELRDYERAYLNVSTEALTALGYGRADLDKLFRTYVDQLNFTFQLDPMEAETCVNGIKALKNVSGPLSGMELYHAYNEINRFIETVCSCMRKSRMIKDSGISKSVIQEVLVYLNANYTQQIKIDELAKRFGVSVSYLSREFTRLTRRSVYEYILYCRVALAKQLMRSGATLNTIAYQCGFNDYSNFLRIFNKMEGVSPSVYREMLQLKKQL